jgi:hypothetical protein
MGRKKNAPPAPPIDEPREVYADYTLSVEAPHVALTDYRLCRTTAAGGDALGLVWHSAFDAADSARRLAACWNACRGIPTAELERGELLGFLRFFVESFDAILSSPSSGRILSDKGRQGIEEMQKKVSAWLSARGES